MTEPVTKETKFIDILEKFIEAKHRVLMENMRAPSEYSNAVAELDGAREILFKFLISQ